MTVMIQCFGLSRKRKRRTIQFALTMSGCFFKSFQKHGNGVLVNFEKVETKPLDMDEVEKKLMDAFAELG
ncbi:hypothetical protein VPHK251G3_0092 [Vibrio phage K251 g3]